jgi:hypothetical protein
MNAIDNKLAHRHNLKLPQLLLLPGGGCSVLIDAL